MGAGRCVLAIDLGSGSVKVALVSRRAEVVASANRPRCRRGATIKWPALYGYRFMTTKLAGATCTTRLSAAPAVSSARHKTQPGSLIPEDT